MRSLNVRGIDFSRILVARWSASNLKASVLAHINLKWVFAVRRLLLWMSNSQREEHSNLT